MVWGGGLDGNERITERYRILHVGFLPRGSVPAVGDPVSKVLGHTASSCED